MSIIGTILAILNAIPILDSWFQQLTAAYAQAAIGRMKAENREAIRAALAAHDQREIEKTIGSPKAGEPSGIPGTEIRDHLPGVDS